MRLHAADAVNHSSIQQTTQLASTKSHYRSFFQTTHACVLDEYRWVAYHGRSGPASV